MHNLKKFLMLVALLPAFANANDNQAIKMLEQENSRWQLDVDKNPVQRFFKASCDAVLEKLEAATEDDYILPASVEVSRFSDTADLPYKLARVFIPPSREYSEAAEDVSGKSDATLSKFGRVFRPSVEVARYDVPVSDGVMFLMPELLEVVTDKKSKRERILNMQVYVDAVKGVSNIGSIFPAPAEECDGYTDCTVGVRTDHGMLLVLLQGTSDEPSLYIMPVQQEPLVGEFCVLVSRDYSD